MIVSANLYELIESSAAAAAVLQLTDGAMPSGHNGPYHDPETPVRNTSHWLITFLKAYEVSGKQRFLEAARRAIAYLCSDAARPMGAAFWHRRNPEKDFCNGLIGQAWTIEALSVAARALEDETCQQLAEAVFLLHPFDEQLGLWRRVSVDGSYLSLDMTFNHQLWFAAAGALLLSACDGRIKQRVLRFMDRLPENLDLYPNGLIRHPLKIKNSTISRSQRFKQLGRNLLRKPKPKRDSKLYQKSLGYHAFNLYALALLKQQIPLHLFWQSVQIRQVLAYIEAEEFVQGLDQNEYGYPYNPPGFEVAYALEVFGDQARPMQVWWVAEQIRRCYDLETHMMSRGTRDPVTHAARLYEATRLPDLDLQIRDS